MNSRLCVPKLDSVKAFERYRQKICVGLFGPGFFRLIKAHQCVYSLNGVGGWLFEYAYLLLISYPRFAYFQPGMIEYIYTVREKSKPLYTVS